MASVCLDSISSAKLIKSLTDVYCNARSRSLEDSSYGVTCAAITVLLEQLFKSSGCFDVIDTICQFNLVEPLSNYFSADELIFVLSLLSCESDSE